MTQFIKHSLSTHPLQTGHWQLATDSNWQLATPLLPFLFHVLILYRYPWRNGIMIIFLVFFF